MRFAARKVAGTRQFYARKVGDGGAGGAGNITPIGGANQASPVLVGSTQPTGPYVSWIGVAASTVEGTPFTLRARLSEYSNVPLVCPVVIDPSSTTTDVALNFPYVYFPAGQLFGSVIASPSISAGGSFSNTVVLTLDPDAELLGFNPGDEPRIVRTEPTFGPDVFSLTVENNTGPGGGFPTFSWGNGDVLVPEGTIQPFQLRLSGEATDFVRIRVTVTAGPDAQNLRDVVEFSRVEEFPIGVTERMVEIEFPENQFQALADPRVNVTATRVGGSVEAGSPTSFVVTVEDNDVGGSQGTPRINFTTVSLGVLEGQSAIVRASRTTTNGSGVTGTRQDVLVSTANIGTTTSGPGGDYDVTWPTVDNYLVFGAGESQAYFTVNVADDGPGDAGESVQFTIAPSATGDYIVGPSNEATVTFLESGTEPTELMVESHRSALPFRVIQGCAAVVPPSPVLPEYSLTNNKRCQVVGQKKNADGLWTSVYWYGQADGSESTPGEPGALGLRRGVAGDEPPTLEGNFPDPLDLEFTILYANEIAPYKTTLGPNGGGSSGRLTGKAAPLYQENWFPESNDSPELCRETLYLNRPRKVTDPPTAPSLFDESGVACGMLELVQTEYSPDQDVIVCNGRFLNGAWAAREDPLAVNKYCDGEINMLSMRVKAPSGWVIDFVDPHTQQSATAAETVDLLKRRDEDYHFPTCSQHQFWFVLRRFSEDPTFDDPIKERAEDYLRYKHIAWAVGELGPTRQAFYGEADELAIDYNRAGLTMPGSGGVRGYKAIRQIANESANGLLGTRIGELEAWKTGVGGTDKTVVEVNGVVLYDGRRLGWWFGVAPAGSGEAGGVQIRGSSALVPGWGWWIRHRILLCGIMGRNRFAYRDVIDGAAGYWWTHAKTVNGEAVTTTHGTGGKRKAYHRPWHFHTDRITDEEFNNNPPDYSYLRLAPGAAGNPSRPWNTPEVRDTGETDIYRFEHMSMTHIARIRQGCNDMWYGCRNWMAYRSLEEVAAYISRTYAPVLAVDQPIDFHIKQYNTGYINEQYALVDVAHRQNGYWGGPGWYRDGGGETRGYAWAALILAGWYAIAKQSIRSRLVGDTLSGALAGKSVMASYWDFIENVATEAGLFSRTIGKPSPNVYVYGANPGPWEATNLPLRRGGLPLGPDFPDDQAPYQLHFHQAFLLKAISAWKRNVWSAQSSPRYAQLDRILRYHQYYNEGAIAFLGDGNAKRGGIVPYGLATAFTDRLTLSNLSEPVTEATSLADTRAGAAVWQFFKVIGGTVESEEYGYASHYHKIAGNAFFASRALDDASLLELAPRVYGRTAPGEVEPGALFEWLFRGGGANVQAELTSLTGGKRYKNYGEWTFAASYIAYLLNVTS